MRDSTVFRKNSQVVAKAKDEDLMLLNTETAEIITLNFVAAFIWSSIDGVKTLDEIIKALHEKFPDATVDDLKQDVGRVIQRLRSKKFIQNTLRKNLGITSHRKK